MTDLHDKPIRVESPGAYEVVYCAECGARVLVDAALHSDGNFFCDDECERRFNRRLAESNPIWTEAQRLARAAAKGVEEDG